MAAKAAGTQPNAEGCKASLPKEKVQSTQIPQSYRERLARDWTWLSQDMLSLCPVPGPQIPFGSPDAQAARVGTGSPLSRGHTAQAPTPTWTPVQSHLLGWVGLSWRTGVSRGLHHAHRGSTPCAANQGDLKNSNIPAPPTESEAWGGIRVRRLPCEPGQRTPGPALIAPPQLLLGGM